MAGPESGQSAEHHFRGMRMGVWSPSLDIAGDHYSNRFRDLPQSILQPPATAIPVLTTSPIALATAPFGGPSWAFVRHSSMGAKTPPAPLAISLISPRRSPGGRSGKY